MIVAGCGGDGEEPTGQAQADVGRGKELFINPPPAEEGAAGQPSCGSCHILADAGTAGTIGPNLDDAFGFSREQGFDDSTFFEVTLSQIDLPAPPMPADLYNGQDAVDVAAYVAACAGIDLDNPPPGCTGPPPAGGGATEPAATQPGETGAAETGDAVEEGRQVFASAGCGSCHTLADAGTAGTIGPNLDESSPSRDLVVERVTNGRGAMPSFRDQLSVDQIGAVADYVSSVAGE